MYGVFVILSEAKDLIAVDDAFVDTP
jgi:hypothetical protein